MTGPYGVRGACAAGNRAAARTRTRLYQRPQRAAGARVRPDHATTRRVWKIRSLDRPTLPIDPARLAARPGGHPPRIDTLELPSGRPGPARDDQAGVTRFTSVGSILAAAAADDRRRRGAVGRRGRPRPAPPAPAAGAAVLPGRTGRRPSIHPVRRRHQRRTTAARRARARRATRSWPTRRARPTALAACQPTLAGRRRGTSPRPWSAAGSWSARPASRSSALRRGQRDHPEGLQAAARPDHVPAEVNPVADRLRRRSTSCSAAFEREKQAAADISHELRTPLAALITTIEVACASRAPPSSTARRCEECRAIAQQMSQLVERMLALAWLDAGVDRSGRERRGRPSWSAGSRPRPPAGRGPGADVQGHESPNRPAGPHRPGQAPRGAS